MESFQCCSCWIKLDSIYYSKYSFKGAGGGAADNKKIYVVEVLNSALMLHTHTHTNFFQVDRNLTCVSTTGTNVMWNFMWNKNNIMLCLKRKGKHMATRASAVSLYYTYYFTVLPLENSLLMIKRLSLHLAPFFFFFFYLCRIFLIVTSWYFESKVFVMIHNDITS